MSNHRKKSAARSDDLISELPDEILLSILRRLSSSSEAAMTTVLSKRWRSPWRSYPFVEFDFRDFNGSGEATDEISSTAVMAHLRQFADATFDRFSRDKLLLMKTLENFVTTFTQFDTVKIHWHRSGKITFEEADNVHPRAIDHLKIDSDLSTSNEQGVLLDGLFWACRPRFLTFIHSDNNGSEKLAQMFSDLTSKYLQRFSEDGGEGFNGDQSWLHQLKDVKTIMRDTEMVKNYLRQEGEWEYVADNAVWTFFELTWY
ncbi:F-box/FBD/LRR-repeat protein At3g52680 [Linum perenne]